MALKPNRLYYGDCLDWMEQWEDNCVDLIYLDPPFNSKTNYNMLFAGLDDGEAQYRAFTDTWSWNDAAGERYGEYEAAVARPGRGAVVGLYQILGSCGMIAYITYMAERLAEMHRILKPTGSIYLHCDPSASHYLKIVMDDIFDVKNFRNEITWERIKGAGKTSQHAAKSFGRCSDTILYYSKTSAANMNSSAVAEPYENLETSFSRTDDKGRYKRRSPFRPPGLGARPNLCYEYKGVFPPHPSGWTVSLERLQELDETGELEFTEDGRIWRKQRPGPGVVPNDFWGDISQVPAKERLGYATQKPLALLERIVKASSKEGDLVLDPFCGCGTAIEAAHILKRRWAGVDISSFAIDLIRRERPHLKSLNIQAERIPKNMRDAHALAQDNRLAFEAWAVDRLPGFAPNTKQTGDKGVDGRGKLAHDPDNFDSRLALAQVKSGAKVNPGDLRDFIGTMNIQEAAIGRFITLEPVTSGDMHKDAAGMGRISVLGETYPRLKLWSIQDYFNHQPPMLPDMMNPYKRGAVMDAKQQHMVFNLRES